MLSITISDTGVEFYVMGLNCFNSVGSMTVSGGYTIARKYIDIIYNYFHLLLPVIFQEIITFIKATMPPFT